MSKTGNSFGAKKISAILLKDHDKRGQLHAQLLEKVNKSGTIAATHAVAVIRAMFANEEAHMAETTRRSYASAVLVSQPFVEHIPGKRRGYVVKRLEPSPIGSQSIYVQIEDLQRRLEHSAALKKHAAKLDAEAAAIDARMEKLRQRREEIATERMEIEDPLREFALTDEGLIEELKRILNSEGVRLA